MNLQSDDFFDGDRLPDQHAYASDNKSPSLRWTDLPEGAREIAIICEDPDAPSGTWVHWVLYSLSADHEGLDTGIPKWPVLDKLGNAKQGKNDFKKLGYDGPHPPPGDPHRYFFRIYVLDDYLSLGQGASAGQLREAMDGHILAEKEIVGTYSR